MRIDPVLLSVDMKSLERGTNRLRTEIPLREIDWRIDEVEPAAESGVLDLLVDYAEKTVACTGTLEAVFRTPCARCLEPAEFGISSGISRLYTSDAALREEQEDAEPLTVEDDLLSIADAVREAVILSVPSKPLCRPGCPGIGYN